MFGGKLCETPRPMLFLILSATTMLVGCVQQPYRRAHPDAAGVGLAPIVLPNPAVSCLGPKEGCVAQDHPQTFSLAYVEFDDAGELWSIGNQRADRLVTGPTWPQSQLVQAIALVDEQKRNATKEKRELLVLAFVHGWHNNASQSDEVGVQNLNSFKQSLQFLSSAERCPKVNGKCPIVVGIFLSWRGRLASPLLFHLFTYANRRNAANRVGGVSMTEAIMLLALATKGAPAPYDDANRCQQPTLEMKKQLELEAAKPGAEPKTLFIVVGHSFGGRALLHGVGQSMLTLLLERKAQSENCVDQWNKKHPDDFLLGVVIVSPLDLIALINPADDAIGTKSMIEAFKRSGIVDAELDHPLMVSIKADGDYETGWVMNLGQKTAGSKPKMHAYDVGEKHAVLPAHSPILAPQVPSACEQGQLGLKKQAWYYQHSAGAIFNMGSHFIATIGPAPDETACHALTPYQHQDRVFWVEGDKGPTSPGYCMEIIPVRSILDKDNGAYSDEQNPQFKFIPSEFYSCPPSLIDGPGKPVAVWNDTPFYVFHAPQDLIPNHDDIFRLGVFNMLISMVQDRGATVPVAPTSTMPSRSQAPISPH